MRRRSKIAHDPTKLRELARLDERVAEIEELPPELLIGNPRANRQATKDDNTKPRKGRSR